MKGKHANMGLKEEFLVHLFQDWRYQGIFDADEPEPIERKSTEVYPIQVKTLVKNALWISTQHFCVQVNQSSGGFVVEQ